MHAAKKWEQHSQQGPLQPTIGGLLPEAAPRLPSITHRPDRVRGADVDPDPKAGVYAHAAQEVRGAGFDGQP